MDFTHFYCDSLLAAQEATLNNPYCVFTQVRGDKVLVTKTNFEIDEVETILEALNNNPSARTKLKNLLLVVQAEFLSHYIDELYSDENGAGVNDPDFIREWYAALQPTQKLGAEAPLISTDWELAQYDMGEYLTAGIHDLVDQETRPTEDEIAEVGINLFNEGILRGWNSHREMINRKKKYKKNLKQQSRAVYEDIKHRKSEAI